MKVLSAEQIRAADQYTIENKPIPSIDLMERACNSFLYEFAENVEVDMLISVIAGPGNNGGDGLGIARMLLDYDYDVNVYIFPSKNTSKDFQTNLERLKEYLEPIVLSENNLELIYGEVIIDAIFGTGLNRKPEGLYEKVIRHINQLDAIRYSVDIPSGLISDSPSEGTIVNANFTISFEVPKLAFFMDENHKYIGEWENVPIGWNLKYLENIDTPYEATYFNYIVEKIKKPEKIAHKGNQGHILLVGGSTGKAGAVILASRAGLRSGSGLVTVRVPFNCLIPLQSAIPEAMCLPDEFPDHLAGNIDAANFNAVGIGPGMGQHPQTADFMKSFLPTLKVPVVLDADALNILANHTELLSLGAHNWVLTPHPGEFRRLFGSWENDFEKIELQRKISQKYKIVIVLKGANTSVSDVDGKVYFNTTGNPGMATAGSGDALTGIISSFLGQGYSLIDAARMGVYLHGYAGDLALEVNSYHALITSDIIDHLPNAFTDVFDEEDNFPDLFDEDEDIFDLSNE